MKFTQKQLDAINHHSNNLQLIACAGSGKTEVVAQRVASILKAGKAKGLAPRNIVAFTFTDKAAAELKDRIILRCREHLGDITGMAEMYVGTMQWPVVFVPALIDHRFPSMNWGGRSVWHVLPADAIPKQHRYRGTLEDERRLFYVAITRSQKFLHMTYAPVPGNRLFQNPSEFLTDVYASKYVKRKAPDYSTRKRLPATPRRGVANVVFSFSDLKYFLECPYQFKLRILYGFNAPIHEALGYGRSLHNALAEVHKRALDGDYAAPSDADELTNRHLHTPYAYKALKENLEKAARKVISDYISDNAADFKNIEFSEKQIEIAMDDGVSVVGRIDLVRRKDTGQTTIVDLKSNDRAQPEEVTEAQLHVYALGYHELTGKNADLVEIYELDDRKRKARSVDEDFIKDVKTSVAQAAKALRAGTLDPVPTLIKCKRCDYPGMCTHGAAACSK